MSIAKEHNEHLEGRPIGHMSWREARESNSPDRRVIFMPPTLAIGRDVRNMGIGVGTALLAASGVFLASGWEFESIGPDRAKMIQENKNAGGIYKTSPSSLDASERAFAEAMLVRSRYMKGVENLLSGQNLDPKTATNLMQAQTLGYRVGPFISVEGVLILPKDTLMFQIPVDDVRIQDGNVTGVFKKGEKVKILGWIRSENIRTSEVKSYGLIAPEQNNAFSQAGPKQPKWISDSIVKQTSGIF